MALLCRVGLHKRDSLYPWKCRRCGRLDLKTDGMRAFKALLCRVGLHKRDWLYPWKCRRCGRLNPKTDGMKALKAFDDARSTDLEIRAFNDIVRTNPRDAAYRVMCKQERLAAAADRIAARLLTSEPTRGEEWLAKALEVADLIDDPKKRNWRIAEIARTSMCASPLFWAKAFSLITEILGDEQQYERGRIYDEDEFKEQLTTRSSEYIRAVIAAFRGIGPHIRIYLHHEFDTIAAEILISRGEGDGVDQIGPSDSARIESARIEFELPEFPSLKDKRKLAKVAKLCQQYPHEETTWIFPTKQEKKWGDHVDRAGAKCVGIVVRIKSDPANEFWRPPRSEDQVGKLAVITRSTWNVLAHSLGFSGASFDLRYADGRHGSALFEEIECGTSRMRGETKIKLTPRNSNGYRNLALLYLRSNIKLDEARQLAEKAVAVEAIAPNYFVLSLACDRNGDTASSFSAIKRAVELEPGNLQYLRQYKLIQQRN